MASPRFFNRELSWLEFNQRVLDQACSDENPPLERVKFLAITSSNLDEFFMVRVGGLQLQEKKARSRKDPSGMTATQQLKAISSRAHQMAEDQYRCYREDLMPLLRSHGIVRLTSSELNQEQLAYAETYFEEQVLPVLTPMPWQQSAAKPLLQGRELYLAVRLRDESEPDSTQVMVLPLERSLNRFIPLPFAEENGRCFMLLEDLVGHLVGRASNSSLCVL